MPCLKITSIDNSTDAQILIAETESTNFKIYPYIFQQRAGEGGGGQGSRHSG